MSTEESCTGTKARYALRDASIDEKRFRCFNAPRIRSTFGKKPELGVDKGSGGD